MRRRLVPLVLTAGLGLGAAVVVVAPPASATTDSTVSTTCTKGNYRVKMTTTFRYLLGDVGGVPTWFVKVAHGDIAQYRYNGSAWVAYDWATYFTLTTGEDSTTEETLGKNPAQTSSHSPTQPGYLSPSRRIWATYAVTGAASCSATHDDSQDSFL